MTNRRGKRRSSDRFSFLGVPKSLQTVTTAMKFKDTCSLEGKSRDKISLCQQRSTLSKLWFFRSHVQMWELDQKESWVLKIWCFWTVVLEKTLESPLDSKKIKLVNPKGNQPWLFIGKTVAEAEAPLLQPSDAKSRLIGKDPDAGKVWRQKENMVAENEMIR